MVRLQFRDEQLNYFKFAAIVSDEFPKALRQTFKFMWDSKYGAAKPWDDSLAVRKLFLAKEGGKTKVLTHLPYDEWDCTALFQATIYSRCFAMPDSSGHLKTLGEMYVKPCALPHGRFHTCVVSPSGNKAETFALAIDQLRLLRNMFCHSASSVMDKRTLVKHLQHAKEAFKALGLKTDQIDDIGGLPEPRFPTREVTRLERKNRIMTFVLFN